MAHSRRLTAIALAAVMTIQPVAAWSECGHHIIAILGYDLLQPAQQRRVLQLLNAHPRFETDFKPKRDGLSESALAVWHIGRAGYWPDVARSQPEFNRPNWHYQLGSSLTIGRDVTVPETPGALPDGADLRTKDLHIAQAIELCRRTLRNESDADADKAIAICWLAHLVGDSHQPCHAGSLYAEGIFPEGDRGANSIPTRQSRNLHALWDGLLGNSYDAGDIARRALEIERNSDTWEAARAAGANRAPLEWLAESSEYGRSHVYTPEVLDAVEAARRAGADKVAQVDLPERYLKAAGALAQKRAAFAAHRLSGILSEDLNSR